MADSYRLNGRPQQQSQQGTVLPQVNARTGNYLAALPQGDAELAGLVRGLSTLNPVLAQIDADQRQDALKQAALEGAAAATKVDTAGTTAEAPVAVPQAPGLSPQAYADGFAPAFRRAVAHRYGEESKTQLLDLYNERRHDPEFNATAWLAEQRTKAIGGVADPETTVIVAKHFDDFSRSVIEDNARIVEGRRQQARVDTMQSITVGAISPDMRAEDIGARFREFVLPQGRDLGFDNTQMASMLLARVQALSDAQGGRPDLFGVFFDSVDPTTKLPIAANPQLAEHVRVAREAAQRLADKKFDEATEVHRGTMRMELENTLATNPAAINPSFFVANIGKGKLFATEQEATQYYVKWMGAMQAKTGLAQAQADAAAGVLGVHPPEVQSQYLNSIFEGPGREMWIKAQQGDEKAAADLGAMILQVQSRSGATEPVGQVARFFQTAVSNLPSPEGPNGRFLAAAALYRAMSGNTQYRSTHVKDDPAEVLQLFNEGVQSHGDPALAYAEAYKAVSPEARAQARAWAADPKNAEKVKSIATSKVEGSWPNLLRLFGAAGRPQNAANVQRWAEDQVKGLIARRGASVTDESIEAFLEDAVARNWVMDRQSRQAVRVPAAFAGPGTRDAIEAYTEKVGNDLKAANRLPDDSVIILDRVDENGTYAVQAVVKGTEIRKTLSTVTLDQVVGWHRWQGELNPEERKLVGDLKDSIRAGVFPDNVPPELVAKARKLGAITPEDVVKLNQNAASKLGASLKSMPSFSLGEAPTFVPPSSMPLVDHKATLDIAQDYFARMGGGVQQDHVRLASSLITLSEGVALKAYDDPGKGAGKNIGMGYNLNANAATVDADLKRAGVPPERIEGVKNGTVELLPEQAQRLLQVALPRYEKQAANAVNAVSPGLWDRLAPAQKAVMIDIAYQTGNPQSFKKALAALSRGDAEAFTAEAKSYYTNRRGERVEDKNRNPLRAAMLAGTASWGALLERRAGAPTNRIS